mgnify:CR=1 FL=1
MARATRYRDIRRVLILAVAANLLLALAKLVVGSLTGTLAMVADVGPSRIDGRASLMIGYPIDAPFPWPRVTDELRPFGDDALLGMTFGIPGSLPGGTPFLLRRVG